MIQIELGSQSDANARIVKYLVIGRMQDSKTVAALTDVSKRRNLFFPNGGFDRSPAVTKRESL